MHTIYLLLLSVFFELLIYYFLFKFLFTKALFSKPLMIVVYILAGIFSFALSIIPIADIVQRSGYILIIMGLALCYKGQFWVKLIVPFLFQVFSFMIEKCCYILLAPLRTALLTHGTQGQNFEYFVGIILSNLIILLVLRLLCSYKNYHFFKENHIFFSLYFIILFTFPVCILFAIDLLSLSVVNIEGNYFLTIIAILLLSSITILFFFLFDGILHFTQVCQQVELLKKQLEHEQSYHQILLDKHQQFQELRHDTRNHFNMIAGLIKNGHYDKALTYAQQQSGRLAATSVIQTGQPLLDTILTIKERQAQQSQIEFQSYISITLWPTFLEIDDLASLLVL